MVNRATLFQHLIVRELEFQDQGQVEDDYYMDIRFVVPRDTDGYPHENMDDPVNLGVMNWCFILRCW